MLKKMACNAFYRVLRATDVLLPETLSGWVRRCWLEPHAELCPECRSRLDRFSRLNRLLREGLLGDGARYAMPRLIEAAAPRPAASNSLRWAVACVSLWIAALLLAALHFSAFRSPALRNGFERDLAGRSRMQRRGTPPPIAPGIPPGEGGPAVPGPIDRTFSTADNPWQMITDQRAP
jgi:hypothetical protein